MPWQTIKKSPETQRIIPNLSDYEQARANFSWNQVRQELTGLPNDQGLNIAYEAVERHALRPRREQYDFSRLRLLKARECGLPEGDLSTLENVAEAGKEAGDGKP